MGKLQTRSVIDNVPQIKPFVTLTTSLWFITQQLRQCWRRISAVWRCIRWLWIWCWRTSWRSPFWNQVRCWAGSLNMCILLIGLLILHIYAYISPVVATMALATALATVAEGWMSSAAWWGHLTAWWVSWALCLRKTSTLTVSAHPSRRAMDRALPSGKVKQKALKMDDTGLGTRMRRGGKPFCNKELAVMNTSLCPQFERDPSLSLTVAVILLFFLQVAKWGSMKWKIKKSENQPYSRHSFSQKSWQMRGAEWFFACILRSIDTLTLFTTTGTCFLLYSSLVANKLTVTTMCGDTAWSTDEEKHCHIRISGCPMMFIHYSLTTLSFTEERSWQQQCH